MPLVDMQRTADWSGRAGQVVLICHPRPLGLGLILGCWGPWRRGEANGALARRCWRARDHAATDTRDEWVCHFLQARRFRIERLGDFVFPCGGLPWIQGEEWDGEVMSERGCPAAPEPSDADAAWRAELAKAATSSPLVLSKTEFQLLLQQRLVTPLDTPDRRRQTSDGGRVCDQIPPAHRLSDATPQHAAAATAPRAAPDGRLGNCCYARPRLTSLRRPDHPPSAQRRPPACIFATTLFLNERIARLSPNPISRRSCGDEARRLS